MRKPKPGVNYDAGALLDSLRPAMETLLQTLAQAYPDKIPTCPSQALRAIHALEAIGSDLLLRYAAFSLRIAMINQRIQLEDFLAVHRCVRLLENPPVIDKVCSASA